MKTIRIQLTHGVCMGAGDDAREGEIREVEEGVGLGLIHTNRARLAPVEKPPACATCGAIADKKLDDGTALCSKCHAALTAAGGGGDIDDETDEVDEDAPDDDDLADGEDEIDDDPEGEGDDAPVDTDAGNRDPQAQSREPGIGRKKNKQRKGGR